MSIVGNNYIIGKEIRGVRDNLKVVHNDILVVKIDLKSLDKRQKDRETRRMSLAMGLFKDCGKNE